MRENAKIELHESRLKLHREKISQINLEFCGASFWLSEAIGKFLNLNFLYVILSLEVFCEFLSFE